MDSVEPNRKLRGIVHHATASHLLVYLDTGLIGSVCPADVDDLASADELPSKFAEGEIVEGTVLGKTPSARLVQFSLSEILPGDTKVRCVVTQEGEDHAFVQCSGNRDGILYSTDAANPEEWKSFMLRSFPKGRVFEGTIVKEIPALPDSSAKLVVTLRSDVERVRSFELKEDTLVHGFVSRVEEKKVLVRLNNDCVRTIPRRFAFDDLSAPNHLQPGMLVVSRVLKTHNGQIVLSLRVLFFFFFWGLIPSEAICRARSTTPGRRSSRT